MNAERNVEICVSVCVLSEAHISVPVCLVVVSSSFQPRAQRLGCLLIYGGEALRLQDRVAAQCASRDLEGSSSVLLFTLCPLKTKAYVLIDSSRASIFHLGRVSQRHPRGSRGFYLRMRVRISDSSCINPITLFFYSFKDLF